VKWQEIDQRIADSIVFGMALKHNVLAFEIADSSIRRPAVARARRAAICELHRVFKCGAPAIARAMGLHHSSVEYALRVGGAK
jgi:hypothetical protein